MRARCFLGSWALVWLVVCSLLITATKGDDANRVKVVPKEAQRRVDVEVDGKPFTSYIWPASLKKPVLFPLRSSGGVVVTRGFPLEPRAGERVDHPHQVGLWFNYGDVNGIDFWNNSDAISPENRGKMGTIRHVKINRVASGMKSGDLEVTMEWVMPDGKVILREDTRFIFRAASNFRAVDRITRLTAQTTRVLFRDNKEGVLGIRVARQLEHPSNRPEIFTDAGGKPTAVPVMDNAGVMGLYVSSEGKQGEAVWGTRGRWTRLTANIGEESVTVAILDHPQNPGYPTYWHARGYGLFAANPLGQKALSNGKEELNLTLEPGKAATFRHRVLVLSGPTTPDEIEGEHRRFIEEIK